MNANEFLKQQTLNPEKKTYSKDDVTIFAELYHEAKKAEDHIVVDNKTMTAEEVLKRYYVFSVDNKETQKQCILEAMEEYASQFRQDVTDQDIEKESEKLYLTLEAKGFLEGARWMRNRMKGKKL